MTIRAAAREASVAERRPPCGIARCFKPRHRAPGFTLIEVVIVVFMMAALAGVAVISFAGFGTDRSVSEPGDELIRLAKTAVRAAAVQGRPFVISFGEKEFGLVGLESGAAGSDRVVLPEGTSLSVLRWGQRDWQPADGQAWMFGANGLCDPIRVRLESPEAVLEMGFNPLTGSPTEKQLTLK